MIRASSSLPYASINRTNKKTEYRELFNEFYSLIAMDDSGDSGLRTNSNRLIAAALLTLLFLSLILLFFYPKQRVVGGLRGGPLAPGESAYREDYSCIGVRYDFCPDWPDYGCDKLCFGLVTHRTCSIEEYDMSTGLTLTATICEGPARPGWGFPER